MESFDVFVIDSYSLKSYFCLASDIYSKDPSTSMTIKFIEGCYEVVIEGDGKYICYRGDCVMDDCFDGLKFDIDIISLGIALSKLKDEISIFFVNLCGEDSYIALKCGKEFRYITS